MQYLSILDFVVPPFFLFIIYFISRQIMNARIDRFPEYKYYIPALNAKIAGGLTLCFVYTLYYGVGDTTQYFADSLSVNKLFFKNPAAGFDIIVNGLNVKKLLYFDQDTGYPAYFRDPSTSFVVQITSVFSIVGFRSYIATTILISWVSFLGIWNLYKVFLREFPELSQQMAIAIFYVPSVLFWGSGILKDTFTLSAIGYFTYAFYTGIIHRTNFFRNAIVMFLSAYLIIIVKSYIFVALLPGAMLWLVSSQITKIGGKFLRYSIAPLFLIFMVGGAYLVITFMGDSLGHFSADKLFTRAVETQRDLKADYYRGNSFDIGDFDSSFESILKVSPNALIAGLFRPYLWESKSLFMFVTALENTFFMCLLIWILFKTKIFGFFKFFFKHHLLTFSLVFSLFFAFSVGLSTSNFGSMVRYKIPAIPFFAASLFVIRHIIKKKEQEKEEMEAQVQTSSANASMFQ